MATVGDGWRWMAIDCDKWQWLTVLGDRRFRTPGEWHKGDRHRIFLNGTDQLH